MDPSEERIRALEERVARLEDALKLRAPAAAPVKRRERRQFVPKLEARVGLAWLNRIGVLTLVIGVGFFFRYAVEAGWIGQTPRVALGVVAGLGALAGAEWIWRTGQTTYAQGITAAGSGILFVSLYAAHALYHLTPAALAFALLIAVTVGTGLLALRYDSQAIAVLALLGGVATPFVLNTGRDPWFALGYALLLDAGAVTVARGRNWPWVEAVALAGTAGLYIAQAGGDRIAATFFIIAFYAIFCWTPVRGVFFAAQVLAPIAAARAWNDNTAVFGLLALGLSAAGLWIADRRPWRAAAAVAAAAFWAGYLLWRSQSLAVATAGFLLFLAWLPWRRRAGAADLVMVSANGAAYLAAGYRVVRHDWLGLFAVATACAYGAAAYMVRKRDQRSALLALAAGWACLILAAPMQFSGYRVTMVWACEAAALAWIGARFAERRAVAASTGMFALVIVRLGFSDAWTYPNPGAYYALINARFATFLIAALCLWGSAYWIRDDRLLALADYLGGHIVMLWALIMEVVGSAARSAAPENFQSAASAGVSILMAAYAVALGIAGVATRTVVNRAVGLALIAFVILKLYLYDVWLLGMFYRVAAFVVLGALLLIMSYFYSRFRTSIESWWRTE